MTAEPVATFGRGHDELRRRLDRTPDSGAGGSAAPVPPHSVDAEQAVLGAILLSDNAHYAFVVEEAPEARGLLRPPPPRRSSRRCSTLFESGGQLDALSVVEQLKAARQARPRPAARRRSASSLAAVPAVGNLRRYAEIVKQTSHLRQLLDASYRIQQSVFAREGEARDIVDAAERTILEIRMGGGQQEFRRANDILARRDHALGRSSRARDAR